MYVVVAVFLSNLIFLEWKEVRESKRERYIVRVSKREWKKWKKCEREWKSVKESEKCEREQYKWKRVTEVKESNRSKRE